ACANGADGACGATAQLVEFRRLGGIDIEAQDRESRMQQTPRQRLAQQPEAHNANRLLLRHCTHIPALCPRACRMLCTVTLRRSPSWASLEGDGPDRSSFEGRARARPPQDDAI